MNDTYQIPRTLEYQNKIKDANNFSTVDLKSGLHQIPLANEGKQKSSLYVRLGVVFITHAADLVCLTNSPQSMQRLTDWLTSDLDNVQAGVRG